MNPVNGFLRAGAAVAGMRAKTGLNTGQGAYGIARIPASWKP